MSTDPELIINLRHDLRLAYLAGVVLEPHLPPFARQYEKSNIHDLFDRSYGREVRRLLTAFIWTWLTDDYIHRKLCGSRQAAEVSPHLERGLGECAAQGAQYCIDRVVLCVEEHEMGLVFEPVCNT